MSRYWKSKQKEDRRERAVTQRLYLLEENLKSDNLMIYTVMGSTGNVYEIQLNFTYDEEEWECNCPDFARRQQKCKHIYFIQYKVLPGFNGSATWAERAMGRYKKPCSVIAPEMVLKEFSKITGSVESEENTPTTVEEIFGNKQRPYLGESCAICFDDMTAECKLVFCYESCGNSVHQDCFVKWAKHQSITSCVHCRHEIDMEYFGVSGKKRKRDGEYSGYINLKSARLADDENNL